MGQAALKAQDRQRAREAFEQALNIPAVREEAGRLLSHLTAEATGPSSPASRAVRAVAP